MSREEKRSSPKGGKRGCLCKDGTYNKKCCTGELQNQGIGNTYNQSQGSTTTQINTTHSSSHSG